ncbi:7TM diverse intracellular signaling domain-containing protein [Maridesulfovibrio frigidus]|uniref:7TM diverse intracellular signaling domain-containing protein n=1 Tax=Maridesulfovibrio frigidus TaxID=340956 RepID=UPI0004E1EF38|nr:7TM diverse intracellular signaling domain-containing protein [Maridesulfovibrio frigidus]
MNSIRLFLIIFILSLCGCVQTGGDNQVKAAQGYLDLSRWDFAQLGLAPLDGDWEFYQHSINSSDSPRLLLRKTKKDFFPIPSIWRGDTTQGVPLTSQGQGIYHLRVQLAPESGADSLYIAGMLSVCRVWVNGDLVAASGTPGNNIELEIPQKHLLTPNFPRAGRYVDIVLELSNFHNKEGGINSSILIGTRDQIQDLINNRRISGAITGGALLIMGIYHLIIFLMLRSNRENLYFGLFCILWCIGTVFSPSSAFLVTKFFTFDWGWYIKICLLPAGLTVPLLLIFYNSLFPQKYGEKVNLIYLVFGGIYIVYILVSPPSAYSLGPLAYFLVSRTAYVYLFASFINDLRKKRKGAIYLAPGYLALACAELNEVFFDFNIFNSVDFAPYGTFMFILSYSLLMSARFSETLSKYEKISGELETSKKDEHDHKIVHVRLSKMLNTVDEALLAVNSDLIIDFCNGSFEKLSGFQDIKIQGHHLVQLFESNGHHEIEDLLQLLRPQSVAAGKVRKDNFKFPIADGKILNASISMWQMEVENETIYVISVSPAAVVLDKRQLAVQIMNSSIECWEKSADQDKASLATQSGLWNVYMEKDGYSRTQTLDRYLSEETLPSRPRWKNVYATVEFVLANTAARDATYLELEKGIAELKKMS